MLVYCRVHPYLAGPSLHPILIGPKPLPVRFTTLSSAILAARALICGWKRLPSWKIATDSRNFSHRSLQFFSWLPKNQPSTPSPNKQNVQTAWHHSGAPIPIRRRLAVRIPSSRSQAAHPGFAGRDVIQVLLRLDEGVTSPWEQLMGGWEVWEKTWSENPLELCKLCITNIDELGPPITNYGKINFL